MLKYISSKRPINICPEEVCEGCAEEGATDIKAILAIDCQEGLEDCHEGAEDCTADVEDCLEPLKDCDCIDPSAGLFTYRPLQQLFVYIVLSFHDFFLLFYRCLYKGMFDWTRTMHS